MAVQMAGPMSLAVGSYRAQCRAKGVQLAVQTRVLDVTSLCDTWEASIGSLESVSFSMDLMGDFAANEVDATYGIGGTFGNSGVPFSMGANSAAVGDLAYVGSGVHLEYTPFDATVGDVAMGKLAGKGSGGLARGVVLASPAAAVTATVTGASNTLGAVPAGSKLLANLHVFSASGTTPTLTVKLQSAPLSNFASPTDRLTFTTATTVPTSQAGTVVAPITDTFWRYVATLTGTSPSYTFLVSAGICAV